MLIESEKRKIIEPEIVMIPDGPVALGLPECPQNMQLPHVWSQQETDVLAFGIAKYPTTVAEYLAFAEQTDYAISRQLLSDPRFQNPQTPAAYISWIDAVRYTQWLARETGKPYRLIRDAEYEKAARGGLVGKNYPWGNAPPDRLADFDNPEGSPQPVGSYAANGYGLHDMVGSIWSWCEECFDQVVKHDHAQMCYNDTLIKDIRLNSICRGGSFKTADPTALYCAYRHEDPIDGRFDCIGFRVACTA